MNDESHRFGELLKPAEDLFQTGNFAQALESYQRVREEYGSSLDTATLNLLRRKELECLYRLGRYEESLGAVEGLKSVYESEGDKRQLGWLFSLKAFCLAQLTSLEEGRQAGEEARKLLEGTAYNLEYGLALNSLGNVYIGLGDLKEAKRLLVNSISAFQRVSPLPQKEIVSSQNLLGQVCFMRGETKEAIEYLTEAVNLCHQNEGDKNQEAMVSGNLGTVHRRAGDWPSASKMLRSSLKRYEQLNNTLEIVMGLTALARLLILQRNFAEADLLLNKAEGLSQDYPRELAMAYESLGDLAKERGQLQKAKEYYQRTLGIARRLAPQGDLINQVQRRRAELLIAEGKDLEGASKCVQEALKVSQSLGDSFEEGCCYRTMGLLLQAKGNPKAAMENFEKATKVLRSIEDRFELANTLLIQGEFSGRIDLLKEAESLFIQIQGAEFYQALALLQMAKVEPFFKSATQQLREAEEIFRARGEEGKLKEVESLKVALNQRLSISQTQKYRVLQGLSSEELEKIFSRVIKEVEADRGFLAYAGDGRKKIKIEASHNLSEEETEGLLSLLTEGNSFEAGRPSILYDTSLDDRFSSLGAYSVMVTPFGNGERIDGFLYLDRQGGKEPFLENEFDLFYLLSERVTKAIYQRIQEELEEELAELRKNLKGSGMLTRNPQMLKILKVIELAKDCDTSILLSGETGTGKDFVARIIHQESIRKDKDFVEIPCGVIPKDLVETELFGYEKGAFTGATSRKLGRVELAEGGTLFLNEVGELPKSTQVKLLRFLDRSEFERVGGNKTIRVNTRVIAATNRDLKAEMEKGVFRKDLYYRLNGFCVGLPSLRERKEDIPLLANHFMKLWGERYEKKVQGMAPEVLEAMMEYDWPGNIRELENMVERMVIMARQGEEITAELLPKEVKKSLQAEAGEVPTLPGKLASVEKEAIWDALKRTNGIKRKAATILGIPEATLRFRMKKHDLTFPQG